MDERAELAAHFERARGHLRAVAYRMLGSPDEADDAVQEAWLRASRAGIRGVDNVTGWLTTIVGRICLDVLRSRRRRGEGLAGTAGLEPVVARSGATHREAEAELRGARRVAEETLTNAGRARFARPALVNGAVGAIVAPRGRLLFVLEITVDGDRAAAIDVSGEPDRLREVRLAVPDAVSRQRSAPPA